MAILKTQPSEQRVEDFLNGLANDRRRMDAWKMLAFMKSLVRSL